MNTVIQTILSRRSCRSFTEASVQTEDVKTLLACAAAAPSGRNQQLGQFTALTDRNKIQKLAAAVGKALGRENYDMYNPAVLIITSNDKAAVGKALGRENYDMYNPAVLIITSNDKTNVFREVDNACAMENIYLASEALGLGCVWINQLKDCFDNPQVRALLNEFGIPENHGVYGCAAVGYRADRSAAKENKTVTKIVD